MQMKILSEQRGLDDYSNRSAQVILDNNGDFGVKYILDDKVYDYRIFPEHSCRYAEDAAENWVIGVINPKDLDVSY